MWNNINFFFKDNKVVSVILSMLMKVGMVGVANSYRKKQVSG